MYRNISTRILALLLIAAVPVILSAQAATITGRVVDEVTLGPLAGANVMLEGTVLGASADVNGYFRIPVPASLVLGQEVNLKAGFIGYVSQTATIVLTAGEITQNFMLAIDVLELESVIVTGMGGTRIREKLGVSISSVKAEEIVTSGEENVVQALAGKAPGVAIVQTSGDPGTSSYIRIRGGASIDRGTQPLFVVDGVPIDNSLDRMGGLSGFGGTGTGSLTETANRASDINNEDIASIEILKGSAAAAIYGSRASNGVVLITTKSGRPGKTKITYKSQYGMSEMTMNNPLTQQRWGQGSGGKASTTSSLSWGPELDKLDGMSTEELEAVKLTKGSDGKYYYDEKGVSILYYDGNTYDHARMYSDGGYIIDNNVTVSGGNQFTTFFLSAGQYFEEGHWIAGSDYQRTTLRLKGTHVVSEKLNLTGNIAYSNVVADGTQRADNKAGMGISALRSPPNFNPEPYFHPETGLHRSYRYQSAAVLKKGRGSDNPFFIMYEDKDPSEVNRVTGYAKAQYDLTDWITVDYHIGSDHFIDERMHVQPPSNSRKADGRLIRADITRHQIDQNLVATIRGDKFLSELPFIDGTLMLGHNLNIEKRRRYIVVGTDMGTYEGFDQLDNCVDLTSFEGQYQKNTESFFGQLTLDLFDQLYITGAIRNDGSSTFGAAQKRHWYPKASMAWNFTKTLPLPLINFGKLRFAYGVSGVQPGAYTTLSNYSAAGAGFGLFTNANLTSSYNGKSGFRHSTSLGNDAIKPERTREYEGGIDLSAFNSRLGIEFTYYDQYTTDVIFDLNVAPSTGAFDQTYNAAEISNKGVELAVNLTPIRSRTLTWDLGLIFASNRNKVDSMAAPTLWEHIAGDAFAMPGEELGVFKQTSWMRFGHGLWYDVDGDGTKDSIDTFYAGQWEKNDVWVDSLGKPVMALTPLTSSWSTNPRWTGSIRNEITLFGSLTFSAFIDIVNERWISNRGKGQNYKYGTSIDTDVRDTDLPINHWLHHGEKAVGPGATDGKGKAFTVDQDWFATDGGYSGDRFQYIEDGGYIKLREVAISYRMRGDFVKNLGLSDISLRLSGRNLWTKTDYTGYDPDTNRSQTSNSRGIDYYNSPQTRVWSMTLRVNY